MDITGLFFRMSTQVKAFTSARIGEKKRIISNRGNFFCFNSTVSNLYNTDAIIYKKKNNNNKK